MASAADYEAKLAEFAALPADWDSYGGIPGDPDVLAAVGVFLKAIVEGRAQLVPIADGGVQVEVYVDGWEFDVEFEPRKYSDRQADVTGVYERAEGG